jgi:hypothetical protein
MRARPRPRGLAAQHRALGHPLRRMPAVLLHPLAVLVAARQLTLAAHRWLRVRAAQPRLTPRPQAALASAR